MLLAVAGIAETGSVLLASGPSSPTTHNFVPDDQLVVLPVRYIVRWFEDAWAKLREREGGMSGASNIVRSAPATWSRPCSSVPMVLCGFMRCWWYPTPIDQTSGMAPNKRLRWERLFAEDTLALEK